MVDTKRCLPSSVECGCCCSSPPSSCYPKLQLAQVGDSFFALNRSCLDIYRRLQRQTTPSQLMHVDVVPFSKLPVNVQKSLSALAQETADDAGVSSRVFDVMSAASGGEASQCCQFLSTSLISGTELSLYQQKNDRTGEVTKNACKEAASWWSRWFFSPGKRSPNTTTTTHQEQNITESESGYPYCCVVCHASFSSPKQLQSHRERQRHFGCSTCCRKFKTAQRLNDHTEFFPHWCETDDDFCLVTSDSEGCFITDDDDDVDSSSSEED